MKLATLFLSALLAFTVTSGTACTGTITDGGFADNGGDEGDGPLTPEEEEEQVALCIGDGEAGGACEVTGDCNAPQVCLGNVCVGPQDNAYTCDPIEGIDCLEAGETCVNGLCIAAPGACETLDDCPLGFTCDAGTCTPSRDGASCSDPGPGPALAGTYETDSILHLRDGLPGIVDGILDVTEDARDIINGQIDLGLPGAIEFIIGGIVSGIIRQYVPSYAIDIINNLATVSDMLDDMRVEGTLILEGEACDGNYRASHTWDYITVNMNGRELRTAPADLPGVENDIAEEFGARYHCGDLLLDKHRIQNTMATLVRWILDTGIEATTGHPNVESALSSIVNCDAVANAVANACTFCGAAYSPARGACEAAVQIGVNKVSQAIDEAAVKMSLIKLQAVIPVGTDGTLDDGIWYGSLVGGDFLGELDADRL